MFQTVIAVLIGMSFLYFILAVLCSGIKEFIAAKIDLRASTLEKAIAGMLSNQPPDPAAASGQPKPATTAALGDLAALFYEHPLILGLGSEGRKPSYIPAQYFSSVLEQVLKAGKSGQDYTTLIG